MKHLYFFANMICSQCINILDNLFFTQFKSLVYVINTIKMPVKNNLQQKEKILLLKVNIIRIQKY